jgi:tetrahydromethanopterin S-methyltransferase subunit A
MNSTFKQVHAELKRGIRLAKCRKCGCMRGTLENLKASLPALKNKNAKTLLEEVNMWFRQLEPLEYDCFGCKYCIPPEAMTILTSKYPALASSSLSSCEFQVSDNSWPPVEGEYAVLDKSASVALSTLASDKLVDKLAKRRPSGLCIVGKTETENIGIDKVVKNIITNPAIRFLIVAGKDTEGHQSGKTMVSLWGKGVSKNMRVIGSKGRRPILKNTSVSDVNKFRKQVQLDDQIGCENVTVLIKRVKDLSRNAESKMDLTSCGCCECHDEATEEPRVATVPRIQAKKPGSIKLDRAGYFVIIPSKKKGLITVEHYSYDNKLQRTIEGKNSRDIYHTIISNKWVRDLGHAAYLGKELARAELSIKKGFRFVQDGA